MQIPQEIPKWLSYQVDSHGIERIRKAVLEVEAQTSGEVVPMIVRSSAPRNHVFWTLLLAIFAILALTIHSLANFVPSGSEVVLEIANIVVSILLAGIFSRLAWFHRLSTPKTDLESAALIRAQLEFYQLNLKQTKARTGVLVFVSLYEHVAVVLADEGISKLCPPQTWETAVAELLGGVRKRDFAGGMCEAIAICGKVLAEKFPRAVDDHDELPNRLVIKD
jgi:putative membrane protein